jgi:hypothetical protein
LRQKPGAAGPAYKNRRAHEQSYARAQEHDQAQFMVGQLALDESLKLH